MSMTGAAQGQVGHGECAAGLAGDSDTELFAAARHQVALAHARLLFGHESIVPSRHGEAGPTSSESRRSSLHWVWREMVWSFTNSSSDGERLSRVGSRGVCSRSARALARFVAVPV
jgi:hypothetical protein